jgi:clathrin heavy chain
MTSYLIENNMMRYIEVYCQKVAPEKTPQVIGKLLDLDTNEDFVRNLLNLVGNMCPVDELVEQVERRNRLRLLQPWLEVRVNSGDTHPATHNAIGKIYITLNREPKQFLEHNQFYDPSVIGQFCERLDPSLAVVAYKHAGGACDQDLIRVTNENGLFKDQARYLIERQDLALWKQVLQPWKFQGEEEDREDDLEVVEGKDEEMMAPHRRALIDQVVQTALPETQNPDEVSSTVRAFMDSELHEELIELLERIVLQGSDFSNNRNLQNLLILTAIKSEPQKVSEFVSRLDNFDGPEIAKIAVQEEYGLYEEAFAIYQKCGKRRDISDEERESHHVAATEVLVKYVNDLTRAQEFAERINLPSVWSVLACAQMGEGMLRECIASFIRANDSSRWVDVLRLSEDQENFDDIIPYLQMARRDIKEAQLDTALIYALARNNNLAALEEFVGVPNVGNIQGTGERCYNEQMFDAAKVLFRSVNNNAKLALCHVALNEFREAVDSATKANSISTWKAVNIACVRNEEFRLANTCGLHIIIHPDHLEELIHNYEELGYWEELLKLLEQGLGLEAAHNGIFTQLGVLYTRYAPEKLMEHIKIFHNRMNIVKVLKACETAYLWDEAVYLYKQDKQYDSAVRTMIAHSCSYDKDIFLDCVQKVRNPEIQYQAIAYFDEYHPIELERLLQVLTPTLDHARVVHQLRRTESLVFAIDYLKSVQKENVGAVNEALNEIYIDEEDYNSLRASIDDYDNFDQMALAQRIEKHELLEFRRIAAHLYRKNGRHQQSIDLSRKDSMFRDAIETAAESQDHDLVEDLLRYFVEVEDKACFTATLYTCYDFIRPDVAMELAWRHGYMDYAMPYMIQYMHHLHNKVTELEQRTAPPAEEDSIGHNEPMHMMGGGPMGMFETPLALTNGSMMMGSMITGPQDPFDEMHHQNAHHQQQAFHSFGGNMGGGMGGNMGNMGNMGGMGGNMGGMGGHMGGGHNMGGF